MLRTVSKNLVSIYILVSGYEDLAEQIKELSSLIDRELKHVPPKLKSRDGYSIVEESIRVEEFETKAMTHITAAQLSLDRLAETMK